MSRHGSLYIEKDTFFHRMNGSVKLILFIAWTIVTFLFLDIRIFGFMLFIGSLLLMLARISFRVIKPFLWVMLGFNILNSIFILIITPEYGSELIGTSTYVFSLGYGDIQLETIIYVITLSLKYATLLPITVLFIFTTHPSKFASSLNRMGIPYKIAYAINIAFRYIPDIQSTLRNIIHSQQARGVSFKKGEAALKQRIRNVTNLAFPLVKSSLQRIDTVSNAMDLRGFGKHNTRTWYNASKFLPLDYVTLFVCIGSVLFALYVKMALFNQFWYPF